LRSVAGEGDGIEALVLQRLGSKGIIRTVGLGEGDQSWGLDQ
jgi:hypothetical protein